MSIKRFNDTWTRQARALGYPSRAVFKLIEANKKFKFMKQGQKVLDLGCAPGSWSKLASRIVGPKGFVMGIDLNQLSNAELNSMGASEGMEIYDSDQKIVTQKKYSKGLSRPSHPDYDDDIEYDIDMKELQADYMKLNLENLENNEESLLSDFEINDHSTKVDYSEESDESDYDLYSQPPETYGLSTEEIERVNKEFTEKKNSYYSGKRGRKREHVHLLPDLDIDGSLERLNIARGDATQATTDGLLKAERAIRRSRSPVRFLQADVTEWTPEPHLQRYFDVIVSDMAPKTTGIPSHDAQLSVELCHAVLDLAAVVLKTPSTKKVYADPNITDSNGSTNIRGAIVQGIPSQSKTTRRTLTELFEAYKQNTLRGRELLDAQLLEQALGLDHIDDIDHFNGYRQSNNGTSISSQQIDHRTLNKLLRKYKPVKGTPSIKSINEKRSKLVDALHPSTSAPLLPTNASNHPQPRSMVEVDVFHGAVLMKCFQGEDFDSLLRRMKQLFVTVKSIKPKSSRSESVEIFLFGKGFKGMKYIEKSILTPHQNDNPGLHNSHQQSEKQGQKQQDEYTSMTTNNDIYFDSNNIAGGSTGLTRSDRADQIERDALRIDKENRLRELQENPTYAQELENRYQHNLKLLETPDLIYFNGNINHASIVSDDILASSPRKAVRQEAKDSVKENEIRVTYELGVYEEDEDLDSNTTRAKTEKGKERAAKKLLQNAMLCLTQGPVQNSVIRNSFDAYLKEGNEFYHRVERTKDQVAINLVADFVPHDPYNGLKVEVEDNKIETDVDVKDDTYTESEVDTWHENIDEEVTPRRSTIRRATSSRSKI